jgi:ribosomal RNA-processing protein 17
MASNVDLLTQSYRVVKAKKRTKLGQANAVVFDEDARRCVHPFPSLSDAWCMTLLSREFLTGFHKRKLAKKEEGKKRAQAREKEERLEARREVHPLFSPLQFLSPTLEPPNMTSI